MLQTDGAVWRKWQAGHAARKRSLTRHACGLTQAHCLINPLDRRDLRQGVPAQPVSLEAASGSTGWRSRPAAWPKLHGMREMQDQIASSNLVWRPFSSFPNIKTRPFFVAAWSAAAQSFSGLAGPGTTRQRPIKYISEGSSSASARIEVLRCLSRLVATGSDRRRTGQARGGESVVDVCRRAPRSPTPDLY